MEYEITLITYLWDGPEGGGEEDRRVIKKTASDLNAGGGFSLVLRGGRKVAGVGDRYLALFESFWSLFLEERPKWRGREGMKGGEWGGFSLDFSVF